MQHLQRIFFFLISATLLIPGACQFAGDNGPKGGTSNQTKEVADTILYPVNVINLDSTDQWADERLKKLDRAQLTDMFFEALYQGNARAIDYFSKKEIPASEIREMEESGKFEREEMAQVQFEESWFFNPETARMTKKVHSVLLAWPVYNNDGELQAYEAGFVLELNPTKTNEP